MTNIPMDVIGLMAKKLDDPTLSSLSQLSKHYKNGTQGERIIRLFRIAREGGLEEVKLALQEGVSIAWVKALLTKKVIMDWEDKRMKNCPLKVKRHTDTLLQLAWRMRDKEMFDVIIAAIDKLNPDQWKQQIKDFEGEQADCLDEMADALAASEADSENVDLAVNSVGGAQARCWKNMAWVMHRLSHADKDWDNKSIDSPFTRDVKNLREFVFHRIQGTGLGHGWYAGVGVCRDGYILVPLGRALTTDARQSRSFVLMARARGLAKIANEITKLKSKCATETQAIQFQLSINPSSECSFGQFN